MRRTVTAAKYSEPVCAGVFLIDVLHAAPGAACAYLLKSESGECALVDCGGKNGEGQIFAAMQELEIAPEAVRWLILTHAHLDHAGCAGKMMRRLPNAVLTGHPSALLHISQPQLKLAKAARFLHGAEFYDREYGELLPVEESRLHPLEDGDAIEFGGEELRAMHSPGHAWHHLSVWQPRADMLYAGDSFGVSFCAGAGGEAAVLPVMPPTQFDPPAMRATIEKTTAHPARMLALSHFGVIANIPSAAAQQLEAMEEWAALSEEVGGTTDDDGFAEVFGKRLRTAARAKLQKRGLNEKQIDRYAHDMRLSSAGYTYLREKQNRKK